MSTTETTSFGRINYKSGDYYEGEAVDGFRHGKGVYYFRNGKKIDGMWVKDRLSGHAIITFPGERTDEGTFDGTQRIGSGVMKWQNGYIYGGTWQDTDKGLNGKGILTTAQGRRFCVKWVEGHIVSRFSVLNMAFDAVFPFKKRIFITLITIALVYLAAYAGYHYRVTDYFTPDPYGVFLTTGDLLSLLSVKAYPPPLETLLIVSTAIIAFLTAQNLILKKISGIRYNDLTIILLTPMLYGAFLGLVGIFTKPLIGELYGSYSHTVANACVGVFLIKHYYRLFNRNDRFELSLILGILFGWLSMIFYRHTFIVIDLLPWYYGIPITTVLAIWTIDRLKSNPPITGHLHHSPFLLLIGLGITFYVLYPWLDMELINNSLVEFYEYIMGYVWPDAVG